MHEHSSVEKKEQNLPQTSRIREEYQRFKQAVGAGENVNFNNAPEGAVFKNFHPSGTERPLLYLKGPDGEVKKWLTESELQQWLETQPKIDSADEVEFDMFSLMLGGLDPSLRDLEASSLMDLLDQVDVPQPHKDKIAKIFTFVDDNSRTSLTEWLHSVLGLSFTCRSMYATTVAGRDAKLPLIGTACYSEHGLLVWHDIRNMRAATPSPFRGDGDVCFDKPYDIQLAYSDNDRTRITRLNSTVFFLARHGVSEEETEATDADQVYISIEEYCRKIFVQDEIKREIIHRRRDENFCIANRLEDYQELCEKRKQEMIARLVGMSERGELDQVVGNIEDFLRSQ